ncbi:MAG TPA: hypothetical protein DIW77_01405, partial [Chromatiaceae bacterium]|nr:hypothetical protein [Chromatiaceae bacterium]
RRLSKTLGGAFETQVLNAYRFFGGSKMSESGRAYGKVRDLVEQKGGTMRFQREAWVISLDGKQAIVEAKGNRSLPELDRLYVPRVNHPRTWEDYIPNAAAEPLALLK